MSTSNSALWALAVAAAVSACGGSEDPGRAGSAEANAIDESVAAQSALAMARNRHSGRPSAAVTQQLSSPDAARAEAAAWTSARAALPTPAAMTPVAAGVESCLERVIARLSVASDRAAAQGPISLRCLAGAYHGLTAQGRACSLKVSSFDGNRFKFNRVGEVVALEAEDDASPALHRLSAGAAAAGRKTLQMNRSLEPSSRPTDSVVLTAGPSGVGPARLLEMRFVQIHGGESTESTCRFVPLNLTSEHLPASTGPIS